MGIKKPYYINTTLISNDIIIDQSIDSSVINLRYDKLSQDASIKYIIDNFINESSLGSKFLWDSSGYLDVSVAGGGGTGDVTKLYVDGSLYIRDLSINELYNYNLIQDASIISSSIYNGASPTTTSVGGILAGTSITGKTLTKILEDMLVAYINPAYTSFSISGQATTIEVGIALSGNKTFTWGINTPTNVSTNSVDIINVTAGNTVIASNLANDGSEVINIGTITNTSPISQQFRSSAENTNNITFQSSIFTISSIYPYFWGKVASLGAPPGGSRPVADQTLINSGTKVVSSSSGTITVNFNSTSDDYLWFAIPSTSTSKTVWYVNALNNGSIGGAVSPGGNLFPVFDSVSIDSPTVLWYGISYKIYITNYQSAVTSNMELRN